jgi:AraC family transcriptional activator of pobA
LETGKATVWFGKELARSYDAPERASYERAWWMRFACVRWSCCACRSEKNRAFTGDATNAQKREGRRCEKLARSNDKRRASYAAVMRQILGADLSSDCVSVITACEAPPDRNAPRPRHASHDYAAISFYTAGRARIEQNGEWSVGEGDILVVPAGMPHRMLEMRGARYWGLALRPPSLSPALLAPLERVRDGAAAVVPIPAARQPFLESLFRELEQNGHEERVQFSVLTLILAEIDRAGGEPPRQRNVVGESLRFIERNCLRRLSLTEIARAVGRSPAYVTTALTKATGRSAGDWILAGRMAEARRLLLTTDEMVDVIAERVGYADATHFIRMFRRAHGMTPVAFRARSARDE